MSDALANRNKEEFISSTNMWATWKALPCLLSWNVIQLHCAFVVKMIFKKTDWAQRFISLLSSNCRRRWSLNELQVNDLRCLCVRHDIALRAVLLRRQVRCLELWTCSALMHYYFVVYKYQVSYARIFAISILMGIHSVRKQFSLISPFQNNESWVSLSIFAHDFDIPTISWAIFCHRARTKTSIVSSWNLYLLLISFHIC